MVVTSSAMFAAQLMVMEDKIVIFGEECDGMRKQTCKGWGCTV
jgi:hypothetical protein